jgi:hypothetical protein
MNPAANPGPNPRQLARIPIRPIRGPALARPHRRVCGCACPGRAVVRGQHDRVPPVLRHALNVALTRW